MIRHRASSDRSSGLTGLILSVLIALALIATPVSTANAAPADQAMADCGMVPSADDGCCTIVCAMVGAVALLPQPGAVLEPIVYNDASDSPPVLFRKAKHIAGPEPPPPRA